MQRWIENVAASDVSTGFHYACGENAMLISITDPAGWKPNPVHNFKEVHEFEFLDAEDEDGFPDEAKISDEQAEQIVALLHRALDNHMNVVVHCFAGICRSGAVVEVATKMGFTATDKFRDPNKRVLSKMMKALGVTYEP
jgi:predicted protein tyrosine phosphatase